MPGYEYRCAKCGVRFARRELPDGGIMPDDRETTPQPAPRPALGVALVILDQPSRHDTTAPGPCLCFECARGVPRTPAPRAA